MKIDKVAMILALTVALSIAATKIAYDYFTIVDYKEIGMYLTVGDHVGFNVDTSALFLGTTLPGGTAFREVTLSNSFNIPLKVDMQTLGNLTRWAYVDVNGFWMQPNENRTVRVSVTVPQDAENGDYEGLLRINFRKA